jgi:Mlc titration factor MtfA (ptsG expression regulator)
MPAYRRLGPEEKERLRAIARVMAAEKQWVGAGGLAMRPEIPIVVSTQAARLLLGVEHDHFRDVMTVVVYPTAYRGGARTGPDGVVTEGVPMAGEAWHRGPVVLAWDDVARSAYSQGQPGNVVLHEFAHRLDMQDGWIDGTPPLSTRAAYGPWREVMTAEHARLVEVEGRGWADVLDGYGATSPSEFFAVATECFFERPRELRDERPALHALLAGYYRQDPAAA